MVLLLFKGLERRRASVSCWNRAMARGEMGLCKLAEMVANWGFERFAELIWT